MHLHGNPGVLERDKRLLLDGAGIEPGPLTATLVLLPDATLGARILTAIYCRGLVAGAGAGKIGNNSLKCYLVPGENLLDGEQTASRFRFLGERPLRSLVGHMGCARMICSRYSNQFMPLLTHAVERLLVP
jgi:hypothetical protein